MSSGKSLGAYREEWRKEKRDRYVKCHEEFHHIDNDSFIAFWKTRKWISCKINKPPRGWFQEDRAAHIKVIKKLK